MDTTTLVAALLHDTVEDTGYTLEALTADFGDEVGHLVDGVTKLDRVVLGTAAEGETIRKMIIAMARDPRVLVIKVADRLHNMRTMRFLPPEKQARKARETLEVIAPLAHRLGMATVKWELEDLAFAILHPKKYEEIVRLVADRAPSRDTYLAKVRSEINATLCEVEDRRRRGGSAEALLVDLPEDDRQGPRLRRHPRPGRRPHPVRRDPRLLCRCRRGAFAVAADGRTVQGLHRPTALRGVPVVAHHRGRARRASRWRCRSAPRDMHRTAEYGIAAHWRYKEAKGRNGVTVGHTAAEIDEMAWMRQLLDWQREAADPGEFLESLRYDLAVQEIFVFTPKGDVITLPTGSTPVDFAYAVHTEVGHRCIGARVNGRLVALERKLENGEVVEVFTSKAPNAGPSRDWQQFVVSPRAKAKIRQWFAKERREEALESGKDAIAREVRRGGLPLQRLMNAESMAALARELRYTDVSALYTAVGEGHVSARHVVQRLVAQLGGDDEAEDEIGRAVHPGTMPVRQRSTEDVGVAVPGAPGVLTKLAKCCTPVPGDNIMGFVTRGGGVSVHRTDCTNAASLQEQAERIIDVKWAPSPSSVFLVAIQVEALDRHRLLSDVTRVLADEKVNILSASVTTSNDRVAISRFTFEMGDPKHLGHVLNVVRNVEGVYDVYRVTSAPPGLRDAQSSRTESIVRPSRACRHRPPPATPAAAILSSVASPVASMVPNTVYVGGSIESA